MERVKGMHLLKDFEQKYPELYAALTEHIRRTDRENGKTIASSESGDKNTDENLSLEQKVKSAWDNDSALRDEFRGDFAVYSAYIKGLASGRVGTIVGKKSESTIFKEGGHNNTDESLPVEQRAKAAWDSDSSLRKEFRDNFKIYLAYEKGVAEGRVRSFGKEQ